MNTEQSMVESFHKKYGCAIDTYGYHPPFSTPDLKLLLLRARLISEESTEFLSAASKQDLVGMVDALCDILYVVYGTAVTMGVDLEPCFAEVHSSNMTKDGGGSDKAGKIQKGPDYRSPNLKDILKLQGFVLH